MNENKILESLKGEKVTISCLNRNESEFYGELLEVNELGAVIKYLEHGREFIEFIPMENINSVRHKILGK
ncbi:MAG: hypothetical protein AB7I27_19150 [Bacteriovoracaceae bacterium]